MEVSGEVPLGGVEKAHTAALETHGTTDQALGILSRARSSGSLPSKERKEVLGLLSHAIDLLFTCKRALGEEDALARATGLPPRPGPKLSTAQRPPASGAGASGFSADGFGQGEYSKLLVAEEVEAELDPGMPLQSVLDSVLRQLSNPQQQQQQQAGIPGLPPATGSQPKSILATLTALSGGMKGLTPRRAALTQRLLEGVFVDPLSGQPRVPGPEGAASGIAGGEGDASAASKRPAAEEDEEGKGPNKKAKKTPLVEEPAGSYLPDDGWEWRKYGRKQMHGQPFPRSYWRCARKDGCNAKKQAERCSDDPTKWRVKYIGQHTHPKPPTRPVTITIVQDTTPAPGAPAAEPISLTGKSDGAPAGQMGAPGVPAGGAEGATGANFPAAFPLSGARAGAGAGADQGAVGWGSPLPLSPPFPSTTKAEPTASGEHSSGSSMQLALGPPSGAGRLQQGQEGEGGQQRQQGQGQGQGAQQEGQGLGQDLIQDVGDLPPLPYDAILMLPRLNEDEGDDPTEQSPAETDFDDASTPPTPLGTESKDGGGFSFDIVPGVSALEHHFPPPALEAPAQQGAASLGGVGEAGKGVEQLNGGPGIDSGGSAVPFSEDMSIMVPPRRASLPGPMHANSPRIVITPRRDLLGGLPGLTPSGLPGLTSDNARAFLSSLLSSPLVTGRLPSSTRVIFEVASMAPPNNAQWNPFSGPNQYNFPKQ